MDKTYDVTGQFRIDQEDLERRFFFLMLNGSYSDPKLGALTAANYGDSMTAQAPFVLLLVECALDSVSNAPYGHARCGVGES